MLWFGLAWAQTSALHGLRYLTPPRLGAQDTTPSTHGPSGSAHQSILAPHEVWSADFKGHFKTGGGLYCYPLTVADGHRANEGIRWRHQWVNVSHVCVGAYVGLEDIDEGVWNVDFGPLTLGRLLERHRRIADTYGRRQRRR
jgi:hypothetical protein